MAKELKLQNAAGTEDGKRVDAIARCIMQVISPGELAHNLGALAKLMALQLIILQKEPHNLTKAQARKILKEYIKGIENYLDHPAATTAGLRSTEPH